jgi:hypothetical protein
MGIKTWVVARFGIAFTQKTYQENKIKTDHIARSAQFRKIGEKDMPDT